MRIHLIAIGGSAMHNLALALAGKGFTVSGSDDEIYDPARSRLASEGLLPVNVGWYPERITKDIDVIILGMHAKPDNPELAKAQALGLPVYSYPEYVFEQSKEKVRVVIGGSHGKTTTTAMILHVLNQQGREADYLVGAQLAGFDNMVKLSDAPVIVIEGDEYLSSPIHRHPKFWYYHPHIAVITGIAWDHINVFPTFANYVEQFQVFAEKIEDKGALIWFSKDKNLEKIIDSAKRGLKLVAYDTPDHHHSPEGIVLQTTAGEYLIKIFGLHNLQNLEAARLVCRELGLSDREFYQSIISFTGAARRLELLASNNHSAVFLDFAHAPSKVAATVAALKHRNSERKLIAVFELHTFSSLNARFLNEYASTLDEADDAIVFYSSHTLAMKNMPPLDEHQVRSAFAKKGLTIFSDAKSLHNHLHHIELQNTNLLLMSSGNFGKLNTGELSNHLIS